MREQSKHKTGVMCPKLGRKEHQFHTGKCNVIGG